MTKPAPIVERRPIAAGQAPRHYTARPDDRMELLSIIATMRDVPRNAVESMPDMFHLLRRLGGRLEAIADRLEQAPAAAPRRPSRAPAVRPAASHAAIVAGVFGQPARPARQRSRTITTRSGRRVRVVEAAGQLKLAL